MVRAVLSRLGSILTVMLIVATLVFLISRVIPGDPASVILGAAGTQDDIAKLRADWGLDKPLLVQYVLFLEQLVRLDFGTSLFLGQPVTAAMLERSELTLSLCLLATLISVAIGMPIGILAGARRDGLVDRFGSALAILGASLPSFWVGLVLMRFLAVDLGWFPVSGWGEPEAGWATRLHHLVLPAIVLSLPNAVLLLRVTRTSMIDVMSQDYIRTARAKGLPAAAVILHHALRNALLPVVTVIGLTAALMIGRTVVTETVFGLPGIGNLVVQAVLRRDYPVLQGVLMTVGGIYVVINLCVDLLYRWIDPRVRGGAA
jgi:peptide/nickel transport system permease protein